KAAARSAHREAVASFEQALAALAHLPESRDTFERAIDLRFELRNSLYTLGEFAAIRPYLNEAEALAKAIGDERRLGLVSGYLVMALVMEDCRLAVEAAQRALTIATRLGDLGLQVKANYFLGLALIQGGNYLGAIDAFRRTVASLSGDQQRQSFGLPGTAY